MAPHRAFATAAVLILVLAGCSSSGENSTGSPSTPEPGTAVTIDSFAFMPGAVTVSAGTTVDWTNVQGVAHTVTSDDDSFDSGSIATDGSFSHTFDTDGVFAYHCSIHPSMTATVTVAG